MKSIYFLVLILSFTNLSFGQDTTMTEIVFKTNGSSPLKVYKLVKEKYFYYGSSYYDLNSSTESHSHYPYTGVSYEREYLLTAPGRILVPHNKELSYVVVDSKDRVCTQFTTTTDGRKQVWNLVPAGKLYKTGKKSIIIGAMGMLASGFLYSMAASQNLKYKGEVDAYRMKRDFYNHTGINPANPDLFTQPLGTDYAQRALNLSSLYPVSSTPVPPADNRMGYGIPVLTSTISLGAIVTGIHLMIRHSPKAERIE